MHLVYVSVSKPEIPIIKLLSNVIKLRENVAINFFKKFMLAIKTTCPLPRYNVPVHLLLQCKSSILFGKSLVKHFKVKLKVFVPKKLKMKINKNEIKKETIK